MASNGYTEKFKVRSYEMDAGGRVSIQSICNYLQEIASIHAARLGFSVTELFKRNLTWVLSRLHLQIQKYPRWGDTIMVETWPSTMSGLFALREFKIRNHAEEIIGQATTSWMILDIKAKKAIEIPEFIQSARLENNTRAIEDSFGKLPVPGEVSFRKSFNVRRSDLDINQHVNNVIYIDWAIEAIPMEYLQDNYISSLEISYRAESHYGDRISSMCAMNDQDSTFLHVLERERDHAQVALARTKLKPILRHR